MRKAFAYITHNNRLLIFSHPLEPSAGLQVPAGSMLDGEVPEAAALREAREETGLEDLRVVRFSGRYAVIARMSAKPRSIIDSFFISSAIANRRSAGSTTSWIRPTAASRRCSSSAGRRFRTACRT